METNFTYRFSPSEIYTNAFVDLDLFIKNDTTDTINFDSDSLITITFPVGNTDTTLALDASFNGKSQTKSFSCAKDNPQAAIFNVTGIKLNNPLAPGAEIHITFEQVAINSIAGTAIVAINDYVLTVEPIPSEVPIVKTVESKFGVLAYLQQLVVGLGQSTLLTWYSTGSAKVKVAGFPEIPIEREFPIQEPSPYRGTSPVNIAATAANTPYTVTAYDINGKASDPVIVYLYQSPAIINEFKAYKTADLAPGQEVGDEPLTADQSITLDWTLTYAASSLLKKPDRSISNPINPMTVVPGRDLVTAYQGNYDAMPDYASYKLSAFGYSDSRPTQELRFKIKPIGIKYFKYNTRAEDGTLSGVTWATDPLNWPALEVQLSNQPYKLIITHPGGTKTTYYLGDNDSHPQIQYFNLTKSGNQGTFSWVGKNLKTLVLTRPDNSTYNVPGNVNTYGTLTEALKTGEYTLTGTANDGSTIISKLSA
ncbi:hypothetical protein ACE38W_14080 [Chitinophaga sp. Hz27]|uniref:hypothetical protein n=1 Tax=Chitinophaga sp. Hz27 TaxID=3347169 RepID=UPI0035DFFF9D